MLFIEIYMLFQDYFQNELTLAGFYSKAFDKSMKEECMLKEIGEAPGRSVCIKILSI